MPRPQKNIVEYRFYQLPPDFPIIYLSGERWRISEFKSEYLHFHNCLEIGICHEGSGVMVFEGKSVEFGAGDVVIVPRYYPHTTYSNPENKSLWSYLFLNLGNLLPDMAQASDEYADAVPLINSFYFLLSKKEYPEINFLVGYIIDELREKKKDYRFAARGLLLTLYCELMRIQATAAKETETTQAVRDILVIKPALDYICNFFMNNISIDHLATLCHLSTTHFRRVFLSIMGSTPHNYLIAVRIDRACALLRTTDEAILTVSERVGFHSTSSFNRSFYKIIGVSPREYRNPAKNHDERPERRHIMTYSGWL